MKKKRTQRQRPDDYSRAEDAVLKALYEKFPKQDILKALPGRDLASIHGRARVLGLKRSKNIRSRERSDIMIELWSKPGSRTNFRWSDEEIEILIENYVNEGPKALTKKLPGRSPDAIRVMAAKLKLKRSDKQQGENWTQEELAILWDNYNKIPMEELLKKLPGRTKRAVESMASKRSVAHKNNNSGRWTEEMIDILKTQCEDHTVRELAAKIPGKSEQSVRSMANRLGLHPKKMR